MEIKPEYAFGIILLSGVILIAANIVLIYFKHKEIKLRKELQRLREQEKNIRCEGKCNTEDEFLQIPISNGRSIRVKNKKWKYQSNPN
jgi:hypothetical protein